MPPPKKPAHRLRDWTEKDRREVRRLYRTKNPDGSKRSIRDVAAETRFSRSTVQRMIKSK